MKAIYLACALALGLAVSVHASDGRRAALADQFLNFYGTECIPAIAAQDGIDLGDTVDGTPEGIAWLRGRQQQLHGFALHLAAAKARYMNKYAVSGEAAGRAHLDAQLALCQRYGLAAIIDGQLLFRGLGD